MASNSVLNKFSLSPLQALGMEKPTQEENLFLVHFTNRDNEKIYVGKAKCNAQLMEKAPKGVALTSHKIDQMLATGILTFETIDESIITKLNLPSDLSDPAKTTQEIHRKLTTNYIKYLKDFSAGLLSLDDIDRKDITYELCEIAIEADPNELIYVPEEFMDEAILKKAIIRDPCSLEFIPEKKKSESLCNLAFEKSVQSIEYFPKDLQNKMLTKELSVTILKKTPHLFTLYNNLFSFTQEEILSFIKEKLISLKDIDNESKSLEICQSAIAINGASLQDLPESIKNSDDYVQLVLLALKNYDSVIYFIPKEKFTQEIVDKAFEKIGGRVLERIPEKFHTMELYNKAVSSWPPALSCIKKEHLTIDLCNLAMENDPSAFRYVPNELKSLEFSIQAYRFDPELIKHIPKQYFQKVLECEVKIRNLDEDMIEIYESFDPIPKGVIKSLSHFYLEKKAESDNQYTRELLATSLFKKNADEIVKLAMHNLQIPPILEKKIESYKNRSVQQFLIQQYFKLSSNSTLLKAFLETLRNCSKECSLVFLASYEIVLSDLTLNSTEQNVKLIFKQFDRSQPSKIQSELIMNITKELQESLKKQPLEKKSLQSEKTLRKFITDRLESFNAPAEEQKEERKSDPDPDIVEKMMTDAFHAALEKQIPLYSARFELELLKEKITVFKDEIKDGGKNCEKNILNFLKSNTESNHKIDPSLSELQNKQNSFDLKMIKKNSFLTILDGKQKTSFQNLNLRISVIDILIKSHSKPYLELILNKDFLEKSIPLNQLQEFTLSTLLQMDLIDKGIPSYQDSFLERFVHNFRDPGALFTYANLHGRDKEMQPHIKKFISDVLAGRFKEERAINNSHKQYLSANQRKAWHTDSSFRFDKDEPIAETGAQFLTRLLGADRASFLEQNRDQTTRLAPLLDKIIETKSASKLYSLTTELKNLLKASPIESNQPFLTALERYIQKVASSTLEIIDGEDYQDLFLSGTEVMGSCQSVYAQKNTNKALLGFVLDGKVKMLAIKDAEGKVLARSFLKLFVDRNNHPVCLLERLYPNNNPYFEKFKLAAIEKAKTLDISLCIDGCLNTDTIVFSKGTKAAFEYEDTAGIGVTSDPYKIDALILYTPEIKKDKKEAKNDKCILL